MPSSIQQAQPPLEFIPPKLSLTVVRTFQTLLPLVMRLQTDIRQVEAHHVEQLVDLFKQFQEGKIRLLLAFRHPTTEDPLALAYLLARLVPKTAKALGVKLTRPLHSHFMYDRGIPLWAGAYMGWVFSHLGGTPIQRGKVDRAGLRSARALFVDGPYPLTAAPEGATNGHNEIVSPLEPGVSQLAFWCVEDLIKAGRSEKVLILPIGIRYTYIDPPWSAIAKLLTDLELDTGLIDTPDPGSDSLDETTLYQRLFRLGEHLLSTMEDFYTRFYYQALPPPSDLTGESNPNDAFSTRLNALLNVALKVAEDYFSLQAKGSVIDRCRRLEQAAWDQIYRDDLNLNHLSPMERGLADRVAEEADLRIWHMRLVESFVAVTGNYVREKPSAERFAETALLMWDTVAQIKGDSPATRPSLGNQRAEITVGAPISVSDRWPAYSGGRRHAKQAITDLTADLQTTLETMATVKPCMI
ncbi:MAG: 1-acyl-sn-glycerol-3-phosphate acyltransferase [Leptolyngbyaceae cyanobacterium]